MPRQPRALALSVFSFHGVGRGTRRSLVCTAAGVREVCWRLPRDGCGPAPRPPACDEIRGLATKILPTRICQGLN